MPDIQVMLVSRRVVIAPLYVDDQLLSQIVLGERAKHWSVVRTMLLREGMPQARGSIGGLYYLPAQLQFLDKREGVVHGGMGEFAEDGPANFGP